MNKTEVKKLFEDENFLSELYKVDSMESLQEFLVSKGVNLSMSDINRAVTSGAQTELTEAELQNVAAGANVLKWIKFAWDCFMFNPLNVY